MLYVFCIKGISGCCQKATYPVPSPDKLPHPPLTKQYFPPVHVYP